ncbi:MAG: hypothetical protein ACLFP6_02315 [Spirochaetaceae bacterium]
MNKRVNTILFVLGASVVNVILMLALFLALFVLFARFLAPSLSPGLNQLIMVVIFVLSIGATYFIYHRMVRWLSTKIDFGNYFDPIFGKRGR